MDSLVNLCEQGLWGRAQPSPAEIRRGSGLSQALWGPLLCSVSVSRTSCQHYILQLERLCLLRGRLCQLLWEARGPVYKHRSLPGPKSTANSSPTFRASRQGAAELHLEVKPDHLVKSDYNAAQLCKKINQFNVN